jgi:outer membrane protein OmpA-like peptidoglycan-associated protein
MASYIDDDELAAVDDGSTREGKVKNRRVVLRILER